MSRKVWDEIIYPFPNINGCTVELWEWLSNFIPHFIVDVITSPRWDKSKKKTSLESQNLSDRIKPHNSHLPSREDT